MYRVFILWLICVAAAAALVHWQELSPRVAPFMALALAAALPSIRFSARRWLAPATPRRRIADHPTTRVVVA